MDPARTKDLVDLAHEVNLTWAANPFTSQHDIVLMYRRAPFSDIAYVFTAVSAPRVTMKSDGTDAEYAIDLDGKITLSAPVQLKQIKRAAEFDDWAFRRNQQGVMQRKRDLTAEGVWPSVLRLINSVNPGFRETLKISRQELGIGGALVSRKRSREILRLFISYAHEDREVAKNLYKRIMREGFIDPWFDMRRLRAGANWESQIKKAIKKADAAIVVTTAKTRRPGYIQHEIKRLKARFSRTRTVASLFPVKVVPCDVLPKLREYHHVELYRSGAYDGLFAQLEHLRSHLISRRQRKRRRRTKL